MRLDSLAAHKDKVVHGATDRAGFGRRYLLPPCAPSRNPVEQTCPKFRARLGAAGVRSRKALEAALGPTLAKINRQDARSCSHLGGYVLED